MEPAGRRVATGLVARARPILDRPLTLVTLLGLGLGLLAASGTLSDGAARGATTGPTATAALIGGLVAAVSVGGALVIWLRTGRGTVRTAGTILVIATALGVMVGVSTTRSVPPPSVAAVGVDEPVAERPAPEARTFAPGDRRAPIRFDDQLGGVIVLLVGLFLLVAAMVFFARQSELRARERSAVYLRSELAVDEPASLDPDAVATALQTSLDDLRASTDPRDAIRAAYGSLLSGLAQIGLERRPYEGPGEYIGRCLASATLPERPITELLGWFEIARFSARPLAQTDADRAGAALQASIDHLRVPVG